MDTLLVTGGSGLLGSSVAELARTRFRTFATYNMHQIDLERCEFVRVDLTDVLQVKKIFEKIRPGVVVHSAALVNVDYCEAHKEETWKANVDATENVAALCEKLGTRLIYVSTDYVFDGERGLYTETDVPAPVNYYAKTKLEGERALERHGGLDYCIARTCIYGWNVQEKHNFASFILNKLRTGQKINAFTDQYNSPMLANNCADALLALADKMTGVSGEVFHVAGSERASKFDFALALSEVFGLDSTLVTPTKFAESAASIAVRRPRDVSLSVKKASEKLDVKLLNLREGLVKMKELESAYLGSFGSESHL